MSEHLGSFANQSQYRMGVKPGALPADTAIGAMQIATAVGTLLANTRRGCLGRRHDVLTGMLGARLASHEMQPPLLGRRLQVMDRALQRSTLIPTFSEAIAGHR